MVRDTLVVYHHVHFPDAGICGPASTIGGGLYAVSPYGRVSHAPFYSENHRMRSEFATEVSKSGSDVRSGSSQSSSTERSVFGRTSRLP